jgi:MoaA/NifB/PqqE/SkfB family radical SAM enzyme
MSPFEENHRLNTQEILEGRTVLKSAPLQINIELMGICDINPPCVFCTGKNFGHNYGKMDLAHLEQYASFLDRCEHINEDSFGEPLMHSNLVELAQRVTARGQRFSFVTNGLLLNERRARGLAQCGSRLGFHVSFNAATAETYFHLCGKDFKRLVANVERYVTIYRELNGDALPDLTLTFIVMRINKGELFQFMQLARDIGAKALLAPLHNRPSVPIGKFGYKFNYLEEILSPDEYRDIGERADAFSREIGLR